MATTRLKNVFDIESFIQEIPIVKQVFKKWDTDSFIEFFFLHWIFFVQMNIYIFKRLKQLTFFSEPLVNDIILWENHEKNSDSQFIQNRAALGYMLFITAYN